MQGFTGVFTLGRKEIRMLVSATPIQHCSESSNQNYARENYKPFTQEIKLNVILLADDRTQTRTYDIPVVRANM